MSSYLPSLCPSPLTCTRTTVLLSSLLSVLTLFFVPDLFQVFWSLPRPLFPTLMSYDPSNHTCQCLSWSLLVGVVLPSCMKDLVLRERVCILCSLRSSQALLSMLFILNPTYVICFVPGKGEQKETPSFLSNSCSSSNGVDSDKIAISWDGIK